MLAVRVESLGLSFMEPLTIITGVVLGALYVWTLYNLPILVRGMRGPLQTDTPHTTDGKIGYLPKFSILVAAKDEENVLGRLLARLVELDYPRDRYEVLVVEDGSKDSTARIGREYEMKFPKLIKFFHRPISTGKPAALNYGLSHAAGEIVAVVDADNVPQRDFLAKVSSYFEDSSITAVQGMTRPINRDDNFVTKLNAYEEAAWFRPYLLGKEKFSLFVPLTGSCGFVRRESLERLGGWEEASVTEDVELAARIVKHKGRIRYAVDVVSFQEYPASFRQFIRQRTRWYRGYMDTFIRYGGLLRNPTKVTIDAEATLSGPLVLNLTIVMYAISILNLLSPAKIFSNPIVLFLAEAATVLTAATLFVCGVVIVNHVRPVRLRNLAWIPVVYAYWFIQTGVALRALLQVVFRRRAVWVRTEKTGKMSLKALT